MIFDLSQIPPYFVLNVDEIEHSHNIVVCPYENVAVIDNVLLNDITINHSIENPKFSCSNETWVIYGTNSEGLNLQYNLTLAHWFDENGEDVYDIIDFFQPK